MAGYGEADSVEGRKGSGGRLWWRYFFIVLVQGLRLKYSSSIFYRTPSLKLIVQYISLVFINTLFIET